MGEAARILNERYTFKDYLQWPEDERWELIEGVAYSMSPSPSWRHQGLASELGRQLGNFLANKPCRVFMAPLDILLPEEGEEDLPDNDLDTVVQPDLVVICDTDKLGERAVRGAPDIAVEVLSPYSWERDLRLKMRVYEERGVREYWVLDGGNRVLTVYSRDESGHFHATASLVSPSSPEHIKTKTGGTIPDIAISTVLPGFSLDLTALFRAVEI